MDEHELPEDSTITDADGRVYNILSLVREARFAREMYELVSRSLTCPN